MEDHTNRHVKFFAAVKQIPISLDIKIIEQLQLMADNSGFLDRVVESTSGLENSSFAGKLRAETQEVINHRLNEIIDFVKNQNKPLQEQERIKNLMKI